MGSNSDDFWSSLLKEDSAPVTKTPFKAGIKVERYFGVAVLADKYLPCTYERCGEKTRYRVSGLSRCRKHVIEEVAHLLDGIDPRTYQNKQVDFSNPI